MPSLRPAKTRTTTDLFGAKKRIWEKSSSEESEQIAFMSWLQRDHPEVWALTWHTPNGGYRHPRTAQTMRMLGVKPGIPDILCLHQSGDYTGIAIEFKRSGSTPCAVSKEQRDWLSRFEDAGYKTVVAFGLDQAIDVMREYLGENQ